MNVRQSHCKKNLQYSKYTNQTPVNNTQSKATKRTSVIILFSHNIFYMFRALTSHHQEHRHYNIYLRVWCVTNVWIYIL
jgi:hypothetical protein